MTTPGKATMAGRTLGWGIVGLGGVAGGQIAPAIETLANSSLVGVVSREPAKAAAFAEQHGALRAPKDYDSLLADPAVDAVYIATPNSLHAEQVIAAARAGKHVLCDKPLASDGADAERVVAECEAAGVRLGITFQTRNHEGMTEIRQLVGDGEIGQVVVVQIEMSPGRTLLKGWRTDPSLAGLGVMNNVGVHAYDLARYLLGAEILEVSAMVSSEEGFDLDTTALSLLRMANGALAYVNVNQTVPNHQPDLVIYGSTGRVIGRNITRPGLAGTIEITGRGGRQELSVSSTAAYQTTVGNFAEAVLSGREPSPSGSDGLESVRVTDALARSAREGRTVRVAARTQRTMRAP